MFVAGEMNTVIGLGIVQEGLLDGVMVGCLKRDNRKAEHYPSEDQQAAKVSSRTGKSCSSVARGTKQESGKTGAGTPVLGEVSTFLHKFGTVCLSGL